MEDVCKRPAVFVRKRKHPHSVAVVRNILAGMAIHIRSIDFALFSGLCYNAPHAGGLFGVEKVKPDPLNLLVNTDAGKQIIRQMITTLRFTRGVVLL